MCMFPPLPRNFSWPPHTDFFEKGFSGNPFVAYYNRIHFVADCSTILFVRITNGVPFVANSNNLLPEGREGKEFPHHPS